MKLASHGPHWLRVGLVHKTREDGSEEWELLRIDFVDDKVPCVHGTRTHYITKGWAPIVRRVGIENAREGPLGPTCFKELRERIVNLGEPIPNLVCGVEVAPTEAEAMVYPPGEGDDLHGAEEEPASGAKTFEAIDETEVDRISDTDRRWALNYLMFRADKLRAFEFARFERLNKIFDQHSERPLVLTDDEVRSVCTWGRKAARGNPTLSMQHLREFYGWRYWLRRAVELRNETKGDLNDFLPSILLDLERRNGLTPRQLEPVRRLLRRHNVPVPTSTTFERAREWTGQRRHQRR